jgi:uncharacterized protein (DUF924 family)
MSDPIEVLDYWLGSVGPAGWYAGGDDLDGEIGALFGPIWDAAQGGGIEHWVDGAAGTLAYLIVCDQFSRNMHRGSPLAFALDAQARVAARRALDLGWDMDAPDPERQFFYMPFEHSENMADQDLAVQLITERVASDPEMALHARAHREIIRQFGRFPYRNDALGRKSSVAEQEFIKNGGYADTLRRLRDAPDA